VTYLQIMYSNNNNDNSTICLNNLKIFTCTKSIALQNPSDNQNVFVISFKTVGGKQKTLKIN